MGQLLPFPRRTTTPTSRGSAQPAGTVPGSTHRRSADEFAAEPLWRTAVGRELRAERQRQRRTLADVGDTAGVSVQYLSEVERGRKEPSSEVLHAVSGALDLRLVDLTARVTRRLAGLSTEGRTVPTRPTGPVVLAA